MEERMSQAATTDGGASPFALPVALEPGSEENGLALMLHGLLAENLAASDAKRRDLAAIRTPFGVVATDADVRVTLAFAGGQCTIYDGLRSDAEVVITADSGKIPELSLLSIRYGVPWVLDEAGIAFVRALLRREVRIRGLVDFPPRWRDTLRRSLDLVRLTRVLSVNG
jgi:hypothetical protein